MHSSSDNIEFTLYSNANNIIEKNFNSLCSNINLETLMIESDLNFDSVQVMCYKCHKVNFKRGGSYIDLPDRIKKEKATTNPKNTGNKRFQYAVTVALNYEKIESHAEIVSNIEPFMNKYNWEKANHPSNIDDSKMLEKNNLTITLHIFYAKETEIPLAYIAKHKLTHEKTPLILLMIPNKKKGWYYLAVKILHTLLRGITSWVFLFLELSSFF